MNNLVIVRGGGDLATGTIYKLRRCGFPVLVLETAAPAEVEQTENGTESATLFSYTPSEEEISRHARELDDMIEDVESIE